MAGLQHGKATPTAETLEAAALAYLARFASSRAQLRRVLLARIRRAERSGAAVDREALTKLVDALLDRLARAGLIDDGRYAAGRAASLARRGVAPQRIRQHLQAKGVGSEEVSAALAELAETMREPELAAAVAFARRRRLGPYRTSPSADPADHARALAAFGRAGFSLATARRVLACRDAEAAEALAAET